MKKTICHVLNWFGDRGSEKTVLNSARSLTQYNHMFLGKVVLSQEALSGFMSVGNVVMEEQDPNPGSFNYPTLNDEFVKEHGIDLVLVYLPGDDLPPYLESLSCKKVLHVLCAKKCLFDPSGFDAVTVPSEYASTLNPHMNPVWVYPVVEKLEPISSKEQVIKRYFPDHDPSESILISRIGSIETVKHVEDFLRVAMSYRQVSNMLFLVAGIGSQSYISSLFGRYHSPNLTYAGRISEQEKSDINAASTVCLYPTEFEAFGYSLAEPMSHGCPVVTYNESACPETIGDGGLAVEFNNLPALARAMVDVVSRPYLRQKLSEKSLARWRTSFTQECYTEKVSKIYQKVLDGA